MNSAKSNTYSYAADAAWARFAPFLSGEDAAMVCVISGEPAGETTRAALAGATERLGYGRDACTFITLTVPNSTALSDADLAFLLESLDPLAIVATDLAGATALSRIFRCALTAGRVTRLLGRPALVFADFAGMLATPAGKQAAWASLKKLAR